MTELIDRYDNWDATIENGVLTIRVNVDESLVDAQPSKSGKSITIATTGGIKRIAKSPLKLSLTVFRKP